MSNTQCDNGMKTMLAGAVLAAYRRVKLDTSGNTVIYAGAGEKGIGVTQNAALTIGDTVTVKLWNAGGTFAIESAGAVVALAAVYGAADGKVDDTVLGEKIGEANEAASGSGEMIEIVATDGVVPQAHVANASATSNTITDNSTGVASAATLEAMTSAANAGSADIGPAKNNIATLAAELVLVKADLASVTTKLNSVLLTLEKNGLHAAS